MYKNILILKFMNFPGSIETQYKIHIFEDIGNIKDVKTEKRKVIAQIFYHSSLFIIFERLFH